MSSAPLMTLPQEHGMLLLSDGISGRRISGLTGITTNTLILAASFLAIINRLWTFSTTTLMHWQSRTAQRL